MIDKLIQAARQSAKRIYIVTDKDSVSKAVSLVNATSSAQAVRHVTADRYESRVASQRDIVVAMQGGVRVEEAAP